ncbi:MAG: hypothetical protein A2070_12925 [Bdellovibrionales bacterium GWC1_52_8]|nr:MAG: hypothetical protein A2X97_03380 [Bdellovibrionales bacterium GWA1_52_35]OFZ37937.1 MAG: hypothetical protein A2070_12925 [Bdellovibrionales bacterium GWC1_52_8]
MSGRNLILISSLVSILIPVMGLAALSETYLFNKTQITFAAEQDGKLLVSQNCVQKDKQPKCEALLKLARASTSGLSLEGGANPGALICSRIGGKVVIGQDAKANERAFCRFPDSSMIAADSILTQAIQNDLKDAGK